MLVYILSVFIILGGLVLLVATPVAGVIFIAIGIGIIVWQKTRKAKAKATPETPPVEPSAAEPVHPDQETHRVAGISHYTKNVLSLGVRNPQYDYKVADIKEDGLEDEEIYEYDFYPMPATLVPEPDNQYDPNAIAVYVEDKLIGYIKAGSTAHVKKLMEEDRIKSITCAIDGGNYKKYDSEEKCIDKTFNNYGAKLTFFLR